MYLRVLQGACRGSQEPLINFWLINQALHNQHRKYHIIQAVYQYQSTDTCLSMYQDLLPIPALRCKNESEKET
jgi:hypothetical protein